MNKLGELYQGTVAIDGITLQNREPLCNGNELPENRYSEVEAREVLDMQDWEGEYVITDEPWGWDVTVTDDDGEKHTSHWCWIPAED